MSPSFNYAMLLTYLCLTYVSIMVFMLLGAPPHEGDLRRVNGMKQIKLSKNENRFGVWTRPGSNRRPPACKAGALPAELRARDPSSKKRMGPGGLEPPTPRLSSVCSNQLSYEPGSELNAFCKPMSTPLGLPSLRRQGTVP